MALPEAVKKPCRQCPWRKKAASGFLGPLTAEEWADAAHGEAAIACHMTVDEDSDDHDEWQEGERQCAGAARYRANVLKLPIRKDIAVGPKDPDVFGSPAEFIQHHTRL